MDMSGTNTSPDRSWIEFRDAEGALLCSVHAEDNGGSVRAWLPAFAPGTLGTEQLCSERDGKVFREEVGELHELPERTGTLFGMHYG
jgi:hypothetical protein